MAKSKRPPKLPSWWQVVNRRRHVLIGRDLAGTITPLERKEHDAINKVLDDVMNAYWPPQKLPDFSAERRREKRVLDRMRRRLAKLEAGQA